MFHNYFCGSTRGFTTILWISLEKLTQGSTTIIVNQLEGTDSRFHNHFVDQFGEVVLGFTTNFVNQLEDIDPRFHHLYDTTRENRHEVSYVIYFIFLKIFSIPAKMVVFGLWPIHDPHKCVKRDNCRPNFVQAHNQ